MSYYLQLLSVYGNGKVHVAKAVNFPQCDEFQGVPGVNVPGLEASSSPVKIYCCFGTDELIDVKI